MFWSPLRERPTRQLFLEQLHWNRLCLLTSIIHVDHSCQTYMHVRTYTYCKFFFLGSTFLRSILLQKEIILIKKKKKVFSLQFWMNIKSDCLIIIFLFINLGIKFLNNVFSFCFTSKNLFACKNKTCKLFKRILQL